MTQPIRLLLAEDHRLMRAGIRSLVESSEIAFIVAEANNGQEAVALVAQHRPDVVLMDIAMPHMSGIEATTIITRDYPETRVLLLSMFANEEYVLEALRRGASGYLLKDADTSELSLALEAVMRGEVFLSPAVARHLTSYIRSINLPLDNLPAVSESVIPAAEESLLTPRQLEILQLIANGRGVKEIAQQLNISIKTVEAHRANMMERLGIFDVVTLVRYALDNGLIS